MEQDPLTGKIIGCAIEVHRRLGAGLLESVYQHCLSKELKRAGLTFESESPINIFYRGEEIGCGFRADFVIERQVLVELKSVSALTSVHRAQTLTYLKLANMNRGLLINFNVAALRYGIERLSR